MLSAQVQAWGQAPQLVEVPAPPPATDESLQVRLIASGLHNIVRARALGKHYTSGPLPHTLGVDGVGTDVATGKPVYFHVFGLPVGSFSELVNVPRHNAAYIPDSVDPVAAAALLNPVTSSWMALKTRVDEKVLAQEGWECLILGATSMSGRLAIKVAREFGAGKVIGAARSREKLQKLDLDEYIVLKDDASSTDFAPASKVAVVLDYLYGPWLAAYFGSTATSKSPVTWVNVGTMAGPEGQLSGATLRSRDVTIRGAGPGAWTLGQLGKEMGAMAGVLKGWKDTEGELKRVDFRNPQEAWDATEGRVVLVKGEYL